MLATNQLGRALYAPVLNDPVRPANTARFRFLSPQARDFYRDWDRTARDMVAVLRAAAGRDPDDKGLSDLVGELSTRSELFRTMWAAHDVLFHRTGRKDQRAPRARQSHPRPAVTEGDTMAPRTWLITGVSSGLGRELTQQLLDLGDRVVGTVRDTSKVADLVEKHPDTFIPEVLEMTDTAAVRAFVDRCFVRLDRIDVVISNAGYGLFGAAEELSDEQVDHIIATNLTGSIALIRSALPHLRGQGGGRIIQISSYGGQVAFPGNSLYHATKWGIEGFCEAVAQEAAPFGIGVTIVEPDGARTEFRYGSARVADLMPEYDDNPAHAFQRMLDPANGLAPGDPARMAARIIDSVDTDPAPLRIVLGTQALENTIATLRKRITDFEAQAELAASTDFPPGE